MINMTIVKMNESKSCEGIAFQPVSKITGTSETLLVLSSKGLIFLFLKLLASSHLPLWLFVSLSLARGLKFDDVKIALNYFDGPFLVRLFLFASCSSPNHATP